MYALTPTDTAQVYIQMVGIIVCKHTIDETCRGLLLVSSLFLDGPVTVGMSLDIASIDTISEINMVRQYLPY